MKCYDCGHLLPDDSDFCQYCGKRVEKEISIQENKIEENVEIDVAADETAETAKINLPNFNNATSEENGNAIIRIQPEEIGKNFKEKIKERKPKVRFCKFCGNQIDAQSKICSGCGRRYFKGIKFNKFFATALFLSVVILTSIILNIIKFMEIRSLKEIEQAYISIISDIEKENKEKSKKLDFFEGHVVFVVDDGTRVYHKYDCYKFKGDFWAYNTEAAQSKGYSACSICH